MKVYVRSDFRQGFHVKDAFILTDAQNLKMKGKKKMSRRTENKEAQAAKEAAKIYNLEVKRAKEYKNTLFFDVEINGVMIYGCRYIEGKNGDFVSFPSYKGNDGKYYSHCYIKLDEASISLIDEQIDKLLG